MYDFVGRNKRIVQVILAIIMIPFAFFGVDSYLRSGDKDIAVATVGGEKVLRGEYDNAMRDQTERFRGMLGKGFDPAMFDNDEVRGQVLDGLVNQKLLKAKGQALNLTATDAQMQKIISEIPQFQEDGKFSPKRYEEMLRGQGMSPLMFEQRLRQDISQQPIQDALSGSHFVATAQTQRWMQLNEQQREISVAQLTNQSFQGQINIDDASAKAHYEKNTSSYQSPELVKLEYFVLSQAAVAAQQVIDPAAVKTAFDTRAKEFATPEERQASHILVKDKKKADELFAQVTAAPAKFAELAKANSEDPGSKDQGGDLGFFARGAMVKPFEDAAYTMKKDEIRGPVASDFGFHIIKLTGVKGGEVPAFESVKAKIETDLRNAAAQAKFGELAQKFQDRVFEQADTFKGIADETKIAPITSGLLTRAQVQAIAMGNPKMTSAVFSQTTINGKKNTEAIEIAPNTLMAARVVEHRAAATRPFDEVKADVVAELKRKAATDLAKTAGEAQLAKLRAGGDATGLTFAAPAQVTRTQRAPGLSEDLAKAVFNAPTDKLPLVLGGPSDQGGYAFVRISKVSDSIADEAKLKTGAQRVASLSASELTTAYLASLKTEIKTTTNKDLIAKKDESGNTKKDDTKKDEPKKDAPKKADEKK
jgi:peptidyl-prolyl cis-trans isomerase D